MYTIPLVHTCLSVVFERLLLSIKWSEYKDSNLGPPGPKPGALPDCATLRINLLQFLECTELLLVHHTMFQKVF